MEHDMEGELRRIEPVLTEILGRPSRWSGRVELTSDPTVRGAKPYRCDIVINEDLAGQDARWRTLIHELLHSYSAGYNSPDYNDLPGWEEGVVEQLQRLLRRDVLSRLEVALDEAVFEPNDRRHDYNRFIAALEALRLSLKEDAGSFYRDLLATPMRDRQAFVLGSRTRFTGQAYADFIQLFSTSNAILKTKR